LLAPSTFLEEQVMNSRRQFIRGISYTGVAMLVGGQARAADAPMVDEKDATAVQLGYVVDASKANKTKYPTYQAGQDCAGCQLYQANRVPLPGRVLCSRANRLPQKAGAARTQRRPERTPLRIGVAREQ